MVNVVSQLKLVVKNDKPMISSRDIAKAFGKEVFNVNKSVRDRYPELIENKILNNQVVINEYGVYEYLLDEYQAIGLVMGFTGDKARAIQEEVVRVFVDYRNGTLQPRLPTDFPSALRMLADKEEQTLRLVKQAEIADKRAFTSMGQLGGLTKSLNTTKAKLESVHLEQELTLGQRKEVEKMIHARAKQLGDKKLCGSIMKKIKQEFGISENNGKWYNVRQKDINPLKELILTFASK